MSRLARSVTERAVERHVSNIVTAHGQATGADDHRLLLAVTTAAGRWCTSELPPAASRIRSLSKSTSPTERSARVALPANWCE